MWTETRVSDFSPVSIRRERVFLKRGPGRGPYAWNELYLFSTPGRQVHGQAIGLHFALPLGLCLLHVRYMVEGSVEYSNNMSDAV